MGDCHCVMLLTGGGHSGIQHIWEAAAAGGYHRVFSAQLWLVEWKGQSTSFLILCRLQTRKRHILSHWSEEFLPLLQAPSSMARKKERLVACPDLPSSALRGLAWSQSLSKHSLESLLNPHAHPSDRPALHAKHQPDARTGAIQRPQAPVPRQGAITTSILCQSVPSLQQLGSWRSFSGPDSCLWALATEEGVGEPMHLDSKAVARLPGWHSQGSGMSAGSPGPPFRHDASSSRVTIRRTGPLLTPQLTHSEK